MNFDKKNAPQGCIFLPKTLRVALPRALKNVHKPEDMLPGEIILKYYKSYDYV